MKVYDAINEGLKNKKNITCGNYIVSFHKNNTSTVRAFGNVIFAYWYDTNGYSWDFCGYEGYPKITRAINYCLEAAGAKFRLKTKKGKIIEVSC